MPYKILVSGERPSFTVLDFNDSKKELCVIENYPAPFNASWVEKSSHQGSTDSLIGLSEGEESGLLYTFQIDHAQKACKISSQQPSLGAPAHCECEGLSTTSVIHVM